MLSKTTNKLSPEVSAESGTLWPSVAGGSNVRAKLVAAIIFLLIVLGQGILHLPATGMGRPYEWTDEIATFNNAHVVSGPTAENTFRYGPLDTFLQWTAIVYYDFFDPIGRTHHGIRYTNNVERSWDDPFLAFDIGKPFDGIGPSYASYNYMEGVDDRYPIFISRVLHFAVFYLIFAALGLAVIFAFGNQAISVIAPLALLSVSPEIYFQATQSLPNAINGLLVFGVVTLALVYCYRQRLSYLLWSAVLVAIGLNFKADMLIAAGAPGLALCLTLYQRGWRAASRDALWAGLLGLATICVTRPALLIAPLIELRNQYNMVVMVHETGGRMSSMENIHSLMNFLALQLFRSPSAMWPVSGLVAFIAVTLSMVAIFAVVLWKRAGAALPLLIGVAVTLVAWAVVILASPIEYHYFINGYAAFLATSGMALFILAQGGEPHARIARGICLVVIAAWGIHVARGSYHSLAITREYARYENLDPTHHRNLAVLAASKLAKTREFSGKVLVDQHSYIDLRLLRLHGIDVEYVNMDTLASVLASFNGAGHLVIFANGTSGNGPYVDNPPNLHGRYDAYVAWLMKLPVLAHFPGTQANVFALDPVERNDDVYVAWVDQKIVARHPLPLTMPNAEMPY